MDKFRHKYRIPSNRMPAWDYAGDGTYFITLVTQDRICHLGKIENEKMILSDWGNIVKNEWIKSFEIRRELSCDEYIIMPNHLHAIVVVKTHGRAPQRDGNDGRASQRDGNDGRASQRDGNDGRASQRDGNDGRASLRDGNDGRASLRDGNDGRASLRDGNDGRASQRDGDDGRASLRANPQRDGDNDPKPGKNQSSFIRKPKSISSFIAGFKSAVNSQIDDYIDDYHLDVPKYNRNNHFFQSNYHDRVIRDAEEYKRIKKYIIENPKNWEDDNLKGNRDE